MMTDALQNMEMLTLLHKHAHTINDCSKHCTLRGKYNDFYRKLILCIDIFVWLYYTEKMISLTMAYIINLKTMERKKYRSLKL